MVAYKPSWNRFHNTNRWFAFRVTGYLRSYMLADTIWEPYQGTYWEHNANKGKNNTLFKDQVPQKPYPI